MAENEIARRGEAIVRGNVFHDYRLVAIRGRAAGSHIGADFESVRRVQISSRQAGSGGHEQAGPVLLIQQHDRAQRFRRNLLDGLGQRVQHLAQRSALGNELEHSPLDFEER